MEKEGRITLVTAVAALLAGLASESVRETVALLVMKPALSAVPSTVMIALLPPGKSPMSKPSAAPLIEGKETPGENVIDFSVKLAGRTSVRITPVAGEGPVFR